MKGQIEGPFPVQMLPLKTEKPRHSRFDLNEVDSLGIYVDGADEINGHMQMIKGGGAALTREKSLLRLQKNLSVLQTLPSRLIFWVNSAASRSYPDGT